METENKHMMQAITEARMAGDKGEVPVGAVLVHYPTNTVAGSAQNRTEIDHDPTAHAEMILIRDIATKTKDTRLTEYDLYVTLEPCPMCAAAISAARIRRLYFGAYDPKSGGVDHGPRIFTHGSAHHKPEVYGGIHEQTCGKLLKEFFKDKR